MLPLGISAASTAQIILLRPRLPETARFVLAVDEQLSLTETELRIVRNAIIKLPLPWFDASEQGVDIAGKPGSAHAYVKQTAGPFIANFKIMRGGAGFIVHLDDGKALTKAWNGFLTITDAVAVIGRYVEWILIGWGLQIAWSDMRKSRGSASRDLSC